MQTPLATLYCPNPNCQTANSEQEQVCQRCRTLLPKRYLFVVGQGVEGLQPGALLANRYMLQAPRVVLDTQPGTSTSITMQTEVPESVQVYLKLFPYRLHVPQVYDLVDPGSDRPGEQLLLLEQAPLGATDLPKLAGDTTALGSYAQGFTRAVPLTQAWEKAGPLRQLNWLWQMAQLWQPFVSQGVASSLLQPKVLRAEGPLVRLLLLTPDQAEPTLAQLGELWSQWLPLTDGAIAPAVDQLCQHLILGKIATAEHLCSQLDQWLAICSQFYSVQLNLATLSDQGPSRKRNEDACYPPSGTVEPNTAHRLAIVCDGVGGHAGGDVASNLAINVLQSHLCPLPLADLSVPSLMAELEAATCAANDQISQQNDAEQRQERQRMGTTLVMALLRAQEIYLTHVGDSRAYWITRSACYQVTLDDDVASREVRLGYASYREALQQPGSGSLIQALGMGSSNLLRPTVQRLILDEDCVLLLCSDGLSDYDRVEDAWPAMLLPILHGQLDVGTASRQLLELANQKNGHDNTTIALVHCQVGLRPDRGPFSPELLPLSEAPPAALPARTATAPTVTPASATARPTAPLTAAPQPQQTHRRSARPLILVLLLLGLGGLVGVAAWLRWGPFSTGLGLPETATPSPSPSPSVPVVATPVKLERGSLLTLTQPVQLRANNQSTAAIVGTAPPETVLQITTISQLPATGEWYQVLVCSLGTSPTAPIAPAQGTGEPDTAASPLQPLTSPGLNVAPNQPLSPPTGANTSRIKPDTEGWINGADLESKYDVLQPRTVSSVQLGACGVTSAPTPEPTTGL